ncbi:tryptophan 2,3-dioxygenase family protein [Micromonospora chokoriensis]|uniref:tryptophan 2,3-dioxygenase family protein n=1 Tax=Micromonospora chokoriensis TaxID=356851 RepID=UPI0004C2D907|nr:tryptophan 2,3-dioxygenase family protein [Micromonospora chokoriensis]
MRELLSWLSVGADPDAFPYETVVAELHRTGKHFIADDLLVLLDQVRAVTPQAEETRLLRDFLHVVLDKRDGRFDYQSYLGLSLLRLHDEPTDDDRVDLRRLHDRLFVHLIADALAFELAAESGATQLLPLQRPEPARVAKRYRLGLRAMSAALARQGRPAVLDPTEPAAAVAALHAMVVADQSPAERRNLLIGMLPVYLVHDEYLFIRVLQAYETTFTMLAAEVRATVDALTDGHAAVAADRLAYGRELLTAAAPLFSLLATMQPESFRTFRVYTEGASAIQSRSYKLVESLCRSPDEPRLSSAAYLSVPEVRDRVLAGQVSVEHAYHTANRLGRLREPGRALLDKRIGEFAYALTQWRQTHYRIATRMLGTRTGTGYTEGTPYLAAARSIPVFTTADNARLPT